MVAVFVLLEDEDDAELEDLELELELELEPEFEEFETLEEPLLTSVPEPKSTLPDAELVPALPISLKAEAQLACVEAVCREAEPLKLQSELLPPFLW